MANNQYINKVIYGGNTLIDLTGDDVQASYVKNGIKFHLPSGAQGTGTNTFDADTSDATMVASELLDGSTGYKNGNKIIGTMPNNGGTDVTVTSLAGTSIPQGYSDGSAKAVIDSTSAAALIAANIRENITILGVTGTMSGSESVHAQAKTATPSTSQQVITPDSPTYNYLSQVTVAAIPYTETDNAAGGKTVTIAA